MTKKNALVSGILGEQLNLDTMVSQRSGEATKISEVLPVSLPVAILETKIHTECRGSMYSTVELKKAVIHQCQIPGQH